MRWLSGRPMMALQWLGIPQGLSHDGAIQRIEKNWRQKLTNGHGNVKNKYERARGGNDVPRMPEDLSSTLDCSADSRIESYASKIPQRKMITEIPNNIPPEPRA